MDGRFKPNQHEGNLVHLLEELSRRRYIEFGIKLGLKQYLIENETTPLKNDPKSCFTSVLEKWLRLGRNDRTWGILVTALEDVGEKEIAEKVKKEYKLEDEVPRDSHCLFLSLLSGVNVARWDEFGLALKVPKFEIQAIANESGYRKQLSDILNLWLKLNGHEPTPETLLAAVKEINEGLAEELFKSSELYALVGRTPPGSTDKKETTTSERTNDVKSDENQPDGKSEEDQPDGETMDVDECTEQDQLSTRLQNVQS